MAGGSGTRGRRPKPTPLKLLAGNPGHRPLPEDEPEPPPASIDPPDHLEGDALAEWNRMAPMLKEAGMFSVADRIALSLVCDVYAEYLDARRKEKEMAPSGVAGGAKGGVVTSPFRRLLYRSRDDLRKLLVEFGMTPSSRSRVMVNPQGGSNDDEEWDDLDRAG